MSAERLSNRVWLPSANQMQNRLFELLDHQIVSNTRGEVRQLEPEELGRIMQVLSRVSLWETVIWQDFAMCRSLDIDPELFFTEEDSTPESKALIAEAQKICESCVALPYCDQAAGVHGVWAGQSETERNRLRFMQQKRAFRKRRRTPL